METVKTLLRHVAAAGLALLLAGGQGAAQPEGPAPPAVGVVEVTRQPVTRSSEFVGRIQATNRVDVVARVAAYLDEVLFDDGAEVRKGDLLYRLEQGPFRAEVQARQAAIAQFEAQLKNAQLTLDRARALLRTPAGQQSSVDAAVASQQALKAQVLGAEAQLQQARINLGYTEIRAPIDGKIGRTAVTVGNYVSSATGVLVSIVSQDPMYVLFPVSTRTVIDLQHRLAVRPDSLVIKLRLPDGSLYRHNGKLDFVDNSVAGTTDTMTLRGVLPNPRLGNARNGARELVDGELVTVILQDAEPTEALAIPRAAVLSDQKGDYVYVVGSDDKAEQRRVTLGQSTPMTASVTGGLKEGEKVILDGIQRVRPGERVSPGPAAPRAQPPASAAPASDPGPRR
ncbi:efflux RND transporter periplasmic adaptor subunit [Enhydrobacter sp.]|uniref:efflux RND transporter periplasmic adaptor subunit n=1 Tax=Enhydrobacter sp. TaxID=1894999 RepID=UPI002632C4DE|nr:efflux RND transporter periplasmic adaptor subunit [Enhydrobacter sp.]WIM09767.1 MAG: RND efflux system, membrane fusion protein [Enhydrobacter sp.]